MRKITRVINIGGVLIGSNNKIAIQSMTNTKTTDVDATVAQIVQLSNNGCDIARVAVPDEQSCDCIKAIIKQSPIPVVVDIHFNADLAIKSIINGASKIRINPGNMPVNKLDSVIDVASEYNVPIRLGVNSGSIDKEMLRKFQNKNMALTESLLKFVAYFEKRNFYNLVLSCKSSSVLDTIATNRILSAKCDYPLHIGLTEAGVAEVGVVKNSVAIGTLLQEGIGDTIRVSLTASPILEVTTAKQIVNCVIEGKRHLEFVSCPKCARCQIDLERYANAVYDHVKNIDKPIKIAVMGCEVNGPGECADADIGLAGGKKISFFKNGKIYKVVEQEKALEEFLLEVDELVK